MPVLLPKLLRSLAGSALAPHATFAALQTAIELPDKVVVTWIPVTDDLNPVKDDGDEASDEDEGD